MSKRNRPEKTTLVIPPELDAIPGGAALAEAIARLGGTVDVVAGEIVVSASTEHDAAVLKAIAGLTFEVK